MTYHDETNALEFPHLYHAAKSRSLNLAELALAGGTIYRVRMSLETRRGCQVAEIVYIDATLPSGERVMVDGTPELTERGAILFDLRDWAAEYGVDADEVGITNTGAWSFMS